MSEDSAITSTDRLANTAVATPRPCTSCAGRLIPTQVDTQLYVRRRGDTSGDVWTATPLESWTCESCGRTDLYATEPERLVA